MSRNTQEYLGILRNTQEYLGILRHTQTYLWNLWNLWNCNERQQPQPMEQVGVAAACVAQAFGLRRRRVDRTRTVPSEHLEQVSRNARVRNVQRIVSAAECRLVPLSAAYNLSCRACVPPNRASL